MTSKESTIGILTDKIGRISCVKCGEELDVGEYTIFERVLCPLCQAEQPVPGKLGNFLLTEELGRGGMGAVYLAKDESLGREVALKVLRQEYGNDPKFMDRLLKEAQAAAALNHRNVVQIYSFGQENHQPYIVMELVYGGRFDLLIKEQVQVEEELLLETAIDVAQGLEAAAQVGLVHGDIKPANILYDQKGVAKVVDFGLARFEGSEGKIEIWGTPYYIAPEKARGKSEDFRSDMYSLGATLFHALAGKPPFDGPTPTDVVVARLKAPAPDVRDFNNKISAKTAAVLKRTMDPTPAMRYPTYDSFLADLHGALDSLRREKEKAAAPAPKKKSKMPLVIGAISAVAVLGIILINSGWDQKTKDGAKAVDSSLKQDYWKSWQKSDATPLSRGESRQFIEAMALMKPGSTMGPLDALVKEKARYSKGSPALAWIETFQVIMHMANGEAEPAKDLLKGLLAPNAVVYENPNPPVENPVTICEYIANRIEEPELRRRSKVAQAWYRQLVDFVVAFKNTIKGNTSKVPGLLAEYNKTQHDYQWSYALQPFARKMALDVEKFNRILSDDSISDPARGVQLAEFANGNYPFWKVAVRNSGPSAGGIETFDQVVKSLKPLLYWRLNDTAIGTLHPEIDSKSINTAKIVISVFGQVADALKIGAGNTYFKFKERSAYDFIVELLPDNQLSSNAGAVTYWFRTDTKENNEMFYAKLGNEALRIRVLGSGVCEAILDGNGGFNLKTSPNKKFNENQWVQVTVSWNGPGNNVSLAVRELNGETEFVTGSYAGKNANFTMVRFGKDDFNNALLYKGDLDELAIWNRGLSETEIKLLTGVP